MRRRVWHIVCAVSLTLAMALAALWVHSLWYQCYVGYEGATDVRGRVSGVSLGSIRGRVGLVLTTLRPPRPSASQWRFVAWDRAPTLPEPWLFGRLEGGRAVLGCIFEQQTISSPGDVRIILVPD